MLADGFDVLGGGGGYRLKGVTYGAGGKISFDVLALGANFYEALRALRISDLDLSLGDAFWTPDINTSYVAAYLANPFADFGANAPASGVINKQYPFYPLHWILTTAFEAIGYTYEYAGLFGSTEAQQSLERYWMPPDNARLYGGQRWKDQFFTTFTNTEHTIFGTANEDLATFFPIVTTAADIELPNSGDVIVTYDVTLLSTGNYTQSTGGMSFDLQLVIHDTAANNTLGILHDFGTTVGNTTGAAFAGTYSGTTNVAFSEGSINKIGLLVTVAASGLGEIYSVSQRFGANAVDTATFTLSDGYNTEILPLASVPTMVTPESVLPNIRISDLLREWLVRFGAYLFVDEGRKKIHAVTAEQATARVRASGFAGTPLLGLGQSWEGLIDSYEISTEYGGGRYAQATEFQMLHDDDTQEALGSATLTINDLSAEKSQTINSIYAACGEVELNDSVSALTNVTASVARIPLWVNSQPQKVQPRFVYLFQQAVQIEGGSVLPSEWCAGATTRSNNKYSYWDNFLALWYGGIANYNSPNVIINARVRLTAAMLAALLTPPVDEPFAAPIFWPIWIPLENGGCWCQIQEISEFNPDGLTSVKLLRIP
jgi:hypothetical protein